MSALAQEFKLFPLQTFFLLKPTRLTLKEPNSDIVLNGVLFCLHEDLCK